jgi:hypothetical protein
MDISCKKAGMITTTEYKITLTAAANTNEYERDGLS